MSWLVENFETYWFIDVFFEDKFIPRPVASIIFHFKRTPIIVDEKQIELKPVFIAPIIPRAITLRLNGDSDIFVAHCKSTVLSRIFNIDLSATNDKSIPVPENHFYPLWERMSNQTECSDRINIFTSLIETLQTEHYKPDAIDQYYDKIIESSIHTPLKIIQNECYESKSSLLNAISYQMEAMKPV